MSDNPSLFKKDRSQLLTSVSTSAQNYFNELRIQGKSVDENRQKLQKLWQHSRIQLIEPINL